ncbi:M20/M25/M40 family metallo-hydrolase [Colwellia sp. RSH04]|uniref:M20/M25/M40 family metallo-hydrolase n=1 Tax=Colwellia sp. RSH04 TaxID=2305464 RepID=UPI000E571422|nr:M20/M25/M40 family metallo-hydrolase [Colwellia sp. RSH04]RHW74924.1 peptidase M23 [Colwellia sp. RSH04]
MLKISKLNNAIRVTAVIAVSALTACNTTQPSVETQVNANISFEQVSKDVTYLASNELQGRGNFSKDINTAANYIAERFKAIGLTSQSGSANDIQSFLQEYRIKTVTPEKLNVTLNENSIPSDKLAIASSNDEINWQNDKTINIHSIGEDDDMRSSLQEINHQGGNHIVLVNTAHEKMFKRYQAYFNRGITKLETSEKQSGELTGGSIILVLSNNKNLKKFTVQASNTVNKTVLKNVVGVLPGKSKADEIVLYSAHYDHLGMQGDSEIFNGADDDASGTSAIINLAEHFSKTHANERTVMFAAFSAEEIGGFGSKYFSKQLNPDTITAMVNIEMIGKPSKFGAGTVWMTGMDRSSLGEQLNNALASTDNNTLKVHNDPYPKQNLFYRSDNATLARLGVPAHSFSSTQLDKDEHYHQTSDDINSVDLSSMHQVIKTLAIATTPLVEGKITPSRIDPNLVKNKGRIY